ncbi:hypothetical protein BN1864_LIB5394:05752 [Pseudomonas sp. 1 R 17]|nr:hypothetical protein BN1864_LIB5394:05752 [Pseudomonas sp. 1 R 17]
MMCPFQGRTRTGMRRHLRIRPSPTAAPCRWLPGRNCSPSPTARWMESCRSSGHGCIAPVRWKWMSGWGLAGVIRWRIGLRCRAIRWCGRTMRIAVLRFRCRLLLGQQSPIVWPKPRSIWARRRMNWCWPRRRGFITFATVCWSRSATRTTTGCGFLGIIWGGLSGWITVRGVRCSCAMRRAASSRWTTRCSGPKAVARMSGLPSRPSFPTRTTTLADWSRRPMR